MSTVSLSRHLSNPIGGRSTCAERARSSSANSVPGGMPELSLGGRYNSKSYNSKSKPPLETIQDHYTPATTDSVEGSNGHGGVKFVQDMARIVSKDDKRPVMYKPSPYDAPTAGEWKLKIDEFDDF